MRIKRRIFIYHTLTVLAALLLLMLVSSVVTNGISDIYQKHSYSADAGDIEQVRELLGKYDVGSEDWAALDTQLETFGYNLYVSKNGLECYSSLDDFQSELYQSAFADVVWSEQGPLTIQSSGSSTVGLRSGLYTVVAIPHSKLPEVFGRQRLQAEAVMLLLIVSGIVTIVVILLITLFSTNHQLKLLMRPLNALAEAAKRVGQGDFSQPVSYSGEDEFTAVCNAFDQMQHHLLSEREKSAAYEKARTDLVAGISHDLRTPLTSVKGYIKGLRDGVANTPEKQAQYLEVAYRRACDMDVLLQRLFYFSKMETGNLPLFPVQTDLGEFVRSFVVNMGGEVEQQGGQLVLKGVPAPHPVRIDTEQMHRVLTNLVENALRYAGAAPVVLTMTVWRERDMERIRFSDNGKGVSEEELPHLFEQFWRADQARGNRGGEGSGLGLYIVKYIVEAHGGTISARNDHGLVFEIALPCEEGI